MADLRPRELLEAYARVPDAEYFTPKAVLHHMALGQPIEGRDAIAAFTRLFYTEAFSDAHPEVRSVSFDETSGVGTIEWSFQGWHTGPLFGIAPTGRRVALPMVAVYRVEADRITEGRLYYDLATLRRQLGVAESAPAERKAAMNDLRGRVRGWSTNGFLAGTRNRVIAAVAVGALVVAATLVAMPELRDQAAELLDSASSSLCSGCTFTKTRLGEKGQVTAATATPAGTLGFAAPGVRGALPFQTVALAPNVWALGDNPAGQLGDGSQTTRAALVKTQLTVGAVSVSAGSSHSLAVDSAGSVWGWGDNDRGQLGAVGVARSTTPLRLPNLTGFKAVAAGDGYSIGLKSDGTVWTWGGQPGSAIRQVKVLNVSKIAAGNSFGYALTTDGSVWEWASPEPGQATLRASRMVDIAAGNAHAIALRADGTVWAWGMNERGQRGDGTSCYYEPPFIAFGDPKKDEINAAWEKEIETRRITLRQVIGLEGGRVTAISAGRDHNLALKADGTVWAWGDASRWQFGIDPALVPYDRRQNPFDQCEGFPSSALRVPGLPSAIAISAGNVGSYVVLADQTLWDIGFHREAHSTGISGVSGVSASHTGGLGYEFRGVAEAIHPFALIIK